MRQFVIALFCVAAARGMPALDNEVNDPGLVGSVIGVVKECVEGDISLCLKEKALKYVESLSSAREMDITDGVSLVGTGSPRSARALEPLSEEPKARESQIESRLLDSAADFLENHVVQFRLPRQAVEGMKRSLEEARGKKKKIKQLLPLFALAKLKITALIPLFLGIIAFAAAKAVLLAKISLLVAGIIALKKLLSSKHHESYEVVAHPVHHEEHYPSSGHGWGRSVDDAQNLAYSSHIKSDCENQIRRYSSLVAPDPHTDASRDPFVTYGNLASGGMKIKLSGRQASATIDCESSKMKCFVLLCLVAAATALPMSKDSLSSMDTFVSALRDCMETDTMLCLKEKALKYTENLASAKEVELVEGAVTLTRTGSPRNARSYELKSVDPKERDNEITARALDLAADFMDNHVIQLRMPKSLLEEDTSLEEEGRGKKKKKLKKLMPILALLKLKLTALIPLFLGIIAFAVFKAYLLGKVAFIAAAIGILKKLLEHKKSSGWSEPAHEEHHGWESSGGWGRSVEAQNLAYSAHAKED
ncbi:uncharacterized protein LOC105391598 [Plutella xylostella]|nr:uncharacterized protein LOC105391598 [Plutella xylostella]